MCDVSSIFSYLMGSFSETLAINGHTYSLGKVLGKGGFSVVYLVQNKHHQRFALKRISCPGKKECESALVEVEILKSFTDHPNFVKMHDFCVVGSSVVKGGQDILILLEYCQNGTLQDLIETEKSWIKEDLLLRIMLGTSEALKQLHQSNPSLVHRDLKPANILLDQNLRPLLTDLGSVSEALRSPSKE